MVKVKVRKKVVSHSQYNMWRACPLEWKLSAVDKLAKSEDTIHNIFGSAMHDTVQEWLDVVFNRSMLVARTMDLSDILKERLKFRFQKSIVEQNGRKIFVTDKETLVEFYHDGVAILNWLQLNVEKFFNVVEWKLEAVEERLNVPIRPNVSFRGYLDIVLRHKLTGAIRIIDLKTSTKGWNKWVKDDKSKTDQLLLYKKFYAEKYNLPEDAITIDFYILKRKLPEESDWPIPRVSKFCPAHGKPSMNQMSKRFQDFVDACFDEEGNHITNQKATPSKSSCRFCPFNQTKHCSVGVREKI